MRSESNIPPTWRAGLARRRKRQKGDAMVEGALVSLGFIMLIIGTIEFGRMVYTFNYLSTAVRDASRYAAIHGTTGTPAAILSYLAPNAVGVNTSNMTVLINGATTGTPCPTSSSAIGLPVKIDLQYAFSPITGLVPQANVTLTSSSQMTISNCAN